MVWAAEIRRLPELFGDYCRSMMPAHVIKRTDLPLSAAHHNNRLTGDLCGDKIACLFKLVRARCRLPRAAKNRSALELRYALVGVPWRWYCGGAFQRSVRIVVLNNFGE